MAGPPSALRPSPRPRRATGGEARVSPAPCFCQREQPSLWRGFSEAAQFVFRVSRLMSFGWVGPLSRSRLAVVAGAYALGIAATGALVAVSIHRLAVALIDVPAPRASDDQVSRRSAQQAPRPQIPPPISQT